MLENKKSNTQENYGIQTSYSTSFIFSELTQIHSLILAVPLSNLEHISIGMVKALDEDDKPEVVITPEESNPEKEKSISGMVNLWNSLTKEFVQVWNFLMYRQSPVKSPDIKTFK